MSMQPENKEKIDFNRSPEQVGNIEYKDFSEAQKESQEKIQEEIEQHDSTEGELAQKKQAQMTSQQNEVTPTQDAILKGIEDILSEDLTDIYFALPPEKKNLFKAKGEEVARKIQIMSKKGRVRARKVFSLIKEWLKLIPGINKYFLQQEAKIKADRITDFLRPNEDDLL